MKQVYLMIYDAGGGHRGTANALRAAIEKRGLPWQVHIVEAFKEILKSSAPQDVYNNLVLKNTFFRIINEPLLVPLFKLQIRLSHFAWVARFKKYWQQHQPDIVVSVMPFINQALCESLHTVYPNVPFVTHLIDLADCPPHFWMEKQKQFIVCPTERAVEQAKLLGHENEQIFRTSGLVINPQFYEPITVDRSTERERLGLKADIPTGLVMFGGQGSKKMLEIAEALEASPLNLQLIFICGHNEKLASALHRTRNRLPRIVETFTNKIPYYMHLSDFFIGKPGPGSISEALAMKLPVITECNALTVFQERYNAEWIANREVGIVVNNFQNIAQVVAELIQPKNLTRYRANVSAVNNQAVFETVDFLERISERSSLSKSIAG